MLAAPDGHYQPFAVGRGARREGLDALGRDALQGGAVQVYAPDAPFVLTFAVEVERSTVGREGRPAAVLDDQLPPAAVGLHGIEIGRGLFGARGGVRRGARDPVA